MAVCDAEAEPCKADQIGCLASCENRSTAAMHSFWGRMTEIVSHYSAAWLFQGCQQIAHLRFANGQKCLLEVCSEVICILDANSHPDRTRLDASRL